VTKLPESYARAIGEAERGTVLPVFVMAGSGGRDQYVVLEVTERRPEGAIRYEDVRDRIRDRKAVVGRGTLAARELPDHRKEDLLLLGEMLGQFSRKSPPCIMDCVQAGVTVSVHHGDALSHGVEPGHLGHEPGVVSLLDVIRELFGGHCRR
jgi:hypothetical protein